MCSGDREIVFFGRARARKLRMHVRAFSKDVKLPDLFERKRNLPDLRTKEGRG